MYTIRTDYRDETVIEKSRFICTLKKVSSETEAQDFIKAVKKEFWDATHNCSAYIIDELAQRSSVNGDRQERQDCRCLKCCGKIS